MINVIDLWFPPVKVGLNKLLRESVSLNKYMLNFYNWKLKPHAHTISQYWEYVCHGIEEGYFSHDSQVSCCKKGYEGIVRPKDPMHEYSHFFVGG